MREKCIYNGVMMCNVKANVVNARTFCRFDAFELGRGHWLIIF